MVKPPLRTKTVGTKLSEPEYAQLEAAARERGLTLSEWCRTVLLLTATQPTAKGAPFCNAYPQTAGRLFCLARFGP